MVRVSKELLSRYNAGEDFLYRIVTGDETWFHYYEPESKTQSKQWKRRDEPVPVKIERIASSDKRERQGKFTRGVLLQHDNARPHVSSKTMAAIDGLGFEWPPHPSYSPDLAPSDYWLFGELKTSSREEL
ncbi:Histone-lysine N-methyltransferase SETMAR [Oopsacas minuta]|uniref:Histone-lysine N-methyltransferase SETMAR n=1 Tax=Oopsacas minuta TaxID=111878 RepID=A0AAV7JH88_9METZ|nr:Histone-lysine N-methyltransferase SETMAR [Oopsacas minuta]